MQLTYRNDKFIFEDGGFNEIKELFDSPEANDWTALNPDDYSTTNPQAAVRFKRFADDKTLKILNRIFVAQYSLHPDLQLHLPSILDSHQIDGVKWILSRSRSYLAHAPGAGKTAQAILAAEFCSGDGQVLFIVPPGLTINWQREILKWSEIGSISPGEIAIVPRTVKKHLMDWDAEFIICPDSMLTKRWVLEELIKRSFRFIAVDEASRFKETTSERFIALAGGKTEKLKSPGLIYDATHVVFMDGSPMPNRAMELWGPITAMAPETIDFMSQSDFGFKYCGAKINDFGRWEFKHTSNWDELRVRLQKSFMHVVTEETLNHPERRRSLVFMNQDPRTPTMKTWEKKFLTTANLSEIDEDLSQGDIASYRRELGLRKVAWVSEYVRMRLEARDESILLFAWHREVAIELCKKLFDFKPGLIIGGTSPEAREDWLERFQKGKTRLLVGNIRALGVGHNIQRANRVVFAEPSWTDEYNKQCEKRASRKGSAHSFIPCEYIVAPRTIDEPVMSAVFRKEQNTKRVIG